MIIEERFVLPAVAMHQSRSHDGILLFSLLRGGPMHSAWWSPDGVQFHETALDGGALEWGDAPVIDTPASRHAMTASGLALFGFRGKLVGLTLSATPRFTPLAFTAPLPTGFVLLDLYLDHDGRWWAGGHAARDEIIGQIFTSTDGATWSLLPGKIDGAVRRLIATPEGLRALHWKHVSAVSMEGCTKLFSMRTLLAEALFLPALSVAVGEGELGALAAGAKRAKYQPCPEQGQPNALVSLAADARGSLWLGSTSGLSHSRDGVSWAPTPLREQVIGLHTLGGEVFAHTVRAVYALRA